MLIEATENDRMEKPDKVSTFSSDFLEEPFNEEDTSELDAWICELLKIYDENSCTQDMNLNTFTKAMDDLSTNATFAVYNYLLLDAGGPKSICSEYWLQRANWHPITMIPLPAPTCIFRSGGKPVKQLYAGCLVG